MTRVGIGWRPEIDLTVERMTGIDFVEVVAESVCADHLPASLRLLRERGLTVLPHGVSLSLGGAAPPEPERLAHLASVAEAVGAPLVSEHVAFVRSGGREAGHLLPVPRTRQALDVLVANVRIAQAALPVPLAVENVAALLGWPDDELTDGQFLAELVDRTGVGLLLDVANLHTNHVNLGLDPVAALEDLPLEAVAYVHVAGGLLRDGVWHDTHAHPVPEEVFGLLTELCSRVAVPAVLLERDDAYPADAELVAELAAVRRVVEAASPRPRQGPAPAPVPAPDPNHRTPTGLRAAEAEGTALDASRGALAAAQDVLLDALLGTAGHPPRFDPDRLRVQADALLAKRRDLVARSRPDLAEALGQGFRAAFDAYAQASTRPPGGVRADAEAFARMVASVSAVPTLT
jgi:uncharacterized protein (UPF0276 family)